MLALRAVPGRSILAAAGLAITGALITAAPAAATIHVSMETPTSPINVTTRGTGINSFSITGFTTVNTGEQSWEFPRPDESTRDAFYGPEGGPAGPCDTVRTGSGGATSSIRCKVRPGAVTYLGSDRRD